MYSFLIADNMKINSALKSDFSVDNGFHHLLQIALGTIEMVNQ